MPCHWAGSDVQRTWHCIPEASLPHQGVGFCQMLCCFFGPGTGVGRGALFVFFLNTFSSCLYFPSVSFGLSVALAAAALTKGCGSRKSTAFSVKILFYSEVISSLQNICKNNTRNPLIWLNPVDPVLTFWENSEASYPRVLLLKTVFQFPSDIILCSLTLTPRRSGYTGQSGDLSGSEAPMSRTLHWSHQLHAPSGSGKTPFLCIVSPRAWEGKKEVIVGGVGRLLAPSFSKVELSTKGMSHACQPSPSSAQVTLAAKWGERYLHTVPHGMPRVLINVCTVL